jgi:hypothetical protein
MRWMLYLVGIFWNECLTFFVPVTQFENNEEDPARSLPPARVSGRTGGQSCGECAIDPFLEAEPDFEPLLYLYLLLNWQGQVYPHL